jgi:HlyD family secretion protein
MKRRFLVWLVWLGCGALAIAAAAAARISWTRRASDQIQVQTVPVRRGVVSRRIIVAGSLQAVTTVDVGSQVSGLISSIQVDFDSTVRKGQVLARLDPIPFQAALDNAKGALEQAQANEMLLEAALSFARTELGRTERMRAAGLMDQSDFDTTKATFDQEVSSVDAGTASIEQAQAGVDQAQANLDHTVITSPLDGVVINRAVDVGQTVAASYQAPVLFTLARDLQKMQVQASVDEADISSVKEGQTATFLVEAYPRDTFSGTISQVRLQSGCTSIGSMQTMSCATTSTTASTTSASSNMMTSANAGVSYTVLIDVANPDYRLKPGLTATVFLAGPEHDNVIRVPNQALLFRPSLDLLKAVGESAAPMSHLDAAGDEESAQVWRYDGKRFTPVGITLGLSDAQWTEQGSGPLEPGDEVVINASFKGQLTVK